MTGTFWPRVLLFGAGSLALLLVIATLFESASGSDFEPLHAGGLYSTYHTMLAALLSLLSFPALIGYLVLMHFGVDQNWVDSFYLALIFFFDGLFGASIWHVLMRLRSRRHSPPDLQPTI